MRIGPVPLGSEDQQLATAVLMSMSGYIGQVAALWELADVCEESVRPREHQGVDVLMREATEASLSGLAGDVQSRIGEAGMEWIAAMQELPQEQVGIAFGLPHGTEQASTAAERAQGALARLLGAYPDIGHASAFLLGFLDALTAVSRVEVMYESIVTALVSAFHTQLRAVFVTVEHERRPELGEEELAGLVEGLINGGLPRWDRWLGKTFDASLPATADELQRISEVFQRRNLFVHHGGAVSTRYASGVATAPPVGSRISADAQYTRDALDSLLLFGTKLAVSIWSAFRPTFATNAELLTIFLTQRYLVRVRAWPAVRSIALWLLNSAADPAQRDFARVLAALSAKRMGDEAHVRALCESWAPATPDLVLIRQVLLGQIDEAFENARRLLAAGLLTVYELDTSPGLADLRDDPRWSELRGSVGQVASAASGGTPQERQGAH